MKTFVYTLLAAAVMYFAVQTTVGAQTPVTVPQNFESFGPTIPVDIGIQSLFGGEGTTIYVVDTQNRLMRFDTTGLRRVSVENAEILSTDWPYLQTFGGMGGEFYMVDQTGRLLWNKRDGDAWQLPTPAVLGSSDWDVGTSFGGLIREDGARNVYRVAGGRIFLYRQTADPATAGPGHLTRTEIGHCFPLQFRAFATNGQGVMFTMARKYGWDEVIDVSALDAAGCVGLPYSNAGSPDLLDPFMRTEASDLFGYRLPSTPQNANGNVNTVSRSGGVPLSTQMTDLGKIAVSKSDDQPFFYGLRSNGNALVPFRIAFDASGSDAPAPGAVEGWSTGLRGIYKKLGIPRTVPCDRGWWGECHTKKKGSLTTYRYGLWCGIGDPKGENALPGELRPVLDTLDQACKYHDQGAWKYNARTCTIPKSRARCSNDTNFLRRAIQLIEDPAGLSPDELEAAKVVKRSLNGWTCVLASDASLYPYYDPPISKPSDIVVNGKDCCIEILYRQEKPKYIPNPEKCWR